MNSLSHVSRRARTFIAIFLIGFPLSLACEYVQDPRYYIVPIYNEFSHSVILLAILAALLDTLGIYALYFIMEKIFGKKWISHWNIHEVLSEIEWSIILVVAGEELALTIGVWKYTLQMPLIPILNVGIFPVLVIALIPLLTLYLSSKVVQK